MAQAVAEGLTPATRGAADGTRVAAAAARHRLLNEATRTQRADLLAAAIAADQQGTAPLAVPTWMAPPPRGRRGQQQRYRQAQEQLAQRQARNRGQRPSKQTAAAKRVVSAADPEAAVGLDQEKTFRPLYNVPVVDDLDSPFVLGYEVFAQPNDAGLLGPLLARVRASLGHGLAVLLADTAYAGGADLQAAADAGVTVYAPLPQANVGKAPQLPRSAFPWLAQEQTYVCPQGQRLVLEAAGKAKRSGPEHLVLRRSRCPPRHGLACPLRQGCARPPASGRTVTRSAYAEAVAALRQRMSNPEAKGL